MSASPTKKIPNGDLFVSEPPPEWFGNGPNPRDNAKWTNKNWLKSRFHFSFAEYRDFSKSNFGVLRVMNDDLVQPARGFGTHPHGDMEIVTLVVDGELTHKDSMGTAETIGRGSIQFMTAGTGVRHSEKNLSEDNHLRFIQMWVTPRQRGLKPNYGSLSGTKYSLQNQWTHLVSDVADKSVETPIAINQDCNMHAQEMDAGKTASFELKAGRQAYFLQIEGESSLSDGTELVRHDAAQIFGPRTFDITAKTKSFVLVVEMKQE